MNKTILVVSGDQDTQAAVAQTLAGNGFRVFSTPDESGAVFQIHLNRPALAIVDVLANEGQQWEALHRIREQSSIPVITLTAFDDYHLKIESLERGADCSMSKPFNNQELRARVRALLRRAGTAGRYVA